MDKFKLAQHQRYANILMDCNEGMGIFFEAGTGKTATVLDWLYRHMTESYAKGEGNPDGVYNALVVCPASLCKSWEIAIGKMSQFEGYTDEGIELLKRNIKITSYQKTYRTIARENGRKTVVLRDEVNQPWGAIAIDESQGIGTHGSKQCTSAILLSALSNHRFILSGTPVAGGGGTYAYHKLYGQMKFIKPTIWKNWSDFCMKCGVVLDKWFKPCGYNNEICEGILKNLSVTARLSECYDMPERVEETIECELPSKVRKAYKEIRAGQLDDYEIVVEQSGTIYTKLLQLCSGNIKREREGLPSLEFECSKEDALIEVLNGTDDKVVIFCNYSASIRRIEELIKSARKGNRLSTRKGKVVIKDGAHKDDWMEFQYGNADVLIAQYKAGGAGLDLFASHTMVLYEPNMSSLDFTQTLARIYRKGQTQRCRYIYLVTPSTLEVRVWETVKAGHDVTERLMDEWAEQNRI